MTNSTGTRRKELTPLVETEFKFTTQPPEGMVERQLKKIAPTDEDKVWHAIEAAHLVPDSIKRMEEARVKHLTQAQLLESNIERWKKQNGVTDDDTNATSRFQLMQNVVVQPPEPPLLGLIAPRGATLIHGRGGTGKGSLAAHVALALIRERSNFRVLIIDAERRPYEWKPRFDALLATPEEQSQIGYYTPTGDALWKQMNELHEHLEAFKPDIVIVDSVARACAVDISTGDTSVPINYYAALDKLAPCHLSIAHNNRGDSFFGSQRWFDDARLVWAYGEQGHARILENTKINSGNHLPPLEVTVAAWTQSTVPMPTGLLIKPYNEALADRIHRILITPMNYDQIEEALTIDTEALGQQPIKRESIRQAMGGRGKDRWTVTGSANKPIFARKEPAVSREKVKSLGTAPSAANRPHRTTS